MNQPYTSGYFQFHLDNTGGNNVARSSTPEYLKSIEGGMLEASIISESLGVDLYPVKHIGTIDAKPITLEIGIADATSTLAWIDESWRLQHSVRNGLIEHGAPNAFGIRNRFSQEFYGAHITEVVFPALTGNDSVYLRVSLQPQRVSFKPGDDLGFDGRTGVEQSDYTTSNFRFSLGGEEIHTVKIDSFTVKQNVQKLYTGRERIPELIPTSLEVSNLTVYTYLSDADPLLAWYQKRIAEGDKESSQDREASITFIGPSDRDMPIGVDLHGVGIYAVEVPQSNAERHEVKLFKASFYVESVSLKGVR